MIILHKSYEIFADYFQFYLMDGDLKGRSLEGFLEDFTEADIYSRIKIGKNIVVIQPIRNMPVPVELEVRDDPSSLDLNGNWQHIAEASLELPSGRLLIDGCANNDPFDEVTVTSGTYRLRAYFAGLDTLSWDGLEGNDRYKIVMWQAPNDEIRVLKQYDFDVS